MANWRPYFLFYKSIVLYIIASSLLIAVGFGIVISFLFFVSLGLVFGFLGFYQFRKKERYFYTNLGLTFWQLAKASFIINLIVGVPVYGLLYILISFMLGDFTITAGF